MKGRGITFYQELWNDVLPKLNKLIVKEKDVLLKLF